MPDLADGESVEMKGSGARPYVLKNTGGVYSCTCPAWRNQSTAIERRTCKHLRKLRGEAAEEARLGGAAPQRPAKKTADGEDGAGPPLLLAQSWDNAADLSGWWMSEKLDGVRAYWDGKQFLSRLGNLFHAPEWFTAGLPETPLDGELWIERKKFQRTVSVVRRQDKSDLWREVRFLVFDAPAAGGGFEERMAFITDCLAKARPEFAAQHVHELCRGIEHLRGELARVEDLGGEGLMLREPRSKYEAGRSSTLLKVKTFHDAEALVLGHEPGAGRHKGRLGALAVQLADGTKLRVGTGFSDAEREKPPGVGSTIVFRYQELSEAGVPRFPSYVGVRHDATLGVKETKASTEPKKKPAPEQIRTKETTPKQETGTRYFEYVEGTSSKFWEVSQSGADMTTRWGRIGSAGQSKTKTFADEAAAARQVEKLIAEKVEEGYVEKTG
ncbi:MAG: DNA ligase [Gemmataceae bacterium]